MFFYTPLVIINRIKKGTEINDYCKEFLQDLYYKKEKNTFICVPLHSYDIIMNTLLNDLKITFDFNNEENNYIFILAHKKFKRDPNNKDMITNEECFTLIKTSNGRLYRLEYEYEEGKYELGEEWILLQDNSCEHHLTQI